MKKLTPGFRSVCRHIMATTPLILSILLAPVMHVHSAPFQPEGKEGANAITINPSASLGTASPYLFGQFIEYMGRDIEGGICQPGSPLSDANGIRQDVLAKVKELAPTLLRFPGGTFVKTFHWMDGVGPRDQRRPSKNLIWGGINTFQFGTCEFIEYCRAVGCEPVLVVNIASGTPDEAANWVEYCNGTENTYYANLRRSHGYPEPFNVKYWALGNEEAADADAGRHQDPKKYVTDMWHFIKLMKLTDPSIELIADGERGLPEWNKTVLQGLDGAVDYISFHAYVSTGGKPYSIYRGINRVEQELSEFNDIIRANSQDNVTNWKKWYRFPARTKPVQVALDEWGIWEYQDPPYGTTNTYEWRHALATACFMNTILRSARFVGMANWAQLVSILAPIMVNDETSIRQTVFYPLREYRAQALGEVVSASVTSPTVDGDLSALNAVATIDRTKGEAVLFVVNISPKPVRADLTIEGSSKAVIQAVTTLTATAIDAKNRLSEPDKNVVSVKTEQPAKRLRDFTFAAESVQILRIKL